MRHQYSVELTQQMPSVEFWSSTGRLVVLLCCGVVQWTELYCPIHGALLIVLCCCCVLTAAVCVDSWMLMCVSVCQWETASFRSPVYWAAPQGARVWLGCLAQHRERHREDLGESHITPRSQCSEGHWRMSWEITAVWEGIYKKCPNTMRWENDMDSKFSHHYPY